MAKTLSSQPLFNLGFRPFFAGAAMLAWLSIAAWLWLLSQPQLLTFHHISLFNWHAHQMIYGYSLAVITGFLLTAVRNWTGLDTPSGGKLALLFLLWSLSRIFWFAGDRFLLLCAALDLSFIVLVCLAIASPIVRRKQWRQMAVLSKLVLLGLGNALFYLAALGYVEQGLHLALYGGLYLVIGLILTIGRRVIPFFIERGVDAPVTLYNARWLDISSMLLFLVFFVSELFLHTSWLTSLSSGALFVITSLRIKGWFTPQILTRPLLWSLLLALVFIDLGFLLFALRDWLNLSPYIPVHAFAVGGIGTITLSMMSRVSIGHTGRNLKQPPALLPALLALLAGSAVVRVVLPVFFAGQYELWLQVSGVMWCLAFFGFCAIFIPMLRSPRPDGKPG